MIFRILPFYDQAVFVEPVDQFHRTVVAHSKPFRQVANGKGFASSITLYNEKSLMLLRGETDLPGFVFAELKKAAKGKSEFRQSGIIGLFQFRTMHFQNQSFRRAFAVARTEPIGTAVANKFMKPETAGTAGAIVSFPFDLWQSAPLAAPWRGIRT